jgi:hypothetical protein
MISPMKSEGPMWSGWQPKFWSWLNSEVTVSECLGMFLRLQMLGTDSSNGLMQKTSGKDGNERPRILRDLVRDLQLGPTARRGRGVLRGA